MQLLKQRLTRDVFTPREVRVNVGLRPHGCLFNWVCMEPTAQCKQGACTMLNVVCTLLDLYPPHGHACAVSW